MKRETRVDGVARPSNLIKAGELTRRLETVRARLKMGAETARVGAIRAGGLLVLAIALVKSAGGES